METKICNTCKTDKPLTEFYKRYDSKDGLHQMCKSCAKLANAKSRSKGKSKSNVHEQAFIAACMEYGIPAMQSTESGQMSYTDVIAWGCVRVEVKYPVTQGNQYIYKFTKRQIGYQLACDVIALVYPTANGDQYHFFSPLHPIFFRENNTRKNAVCYTPSGTARRSYGVRLDDIIMRSHENNWHMIETLRLDKMQQLKAEYRRNLHPAIEETKAA